MKNSTMRNLLRRIGCFMVAFAMILTSANLSSSAFAKSAAKAPKLSKKKVTVTVGSSVKVKVKKAPKGAKLKWASKNKKIATVKNGKIKGVKAGKTKVTCNVAYKVKGKKVKKNLKVNVTVVDKTESTVAPVATTAAAVAATTPAVATKAPEAQATATAGTDAQETAAAETEAPASTAPAKKVPDDPEKAALLEQTNVGEEHKSASGLTIKDNGLMRKELTSLDLIDYDMGIGWNMGNQLEESNFKGTHSTVEGCETNAGNPAATQETFDGLKKYGVNTVRIPVAWSNLMSTDGNYTINEDLLNRVEEVVNYALNDGMYVIINEHWDGGWWGMFGSPDENVRKEAWKKWEAIWTQISERFKDYSDHLIFEAQNEELSGAFPTTGNLGLNTRVGENGFYDGTAPLGTLTEDEIYETAYEISQKFVDIVRQSGGNNAYRHLLIPGNTTAIDKAIDERFKMPVDTEENGKNKLSVDVHIYEPQGYALTASASDDGYRNSWGTDEDKTFLENLVKKTEKFTSEGYGVIAGECGVVKADKDNIIDWARYYFGLCETYHITPCWWDEGHYFNRSGGYFNYSDVGDFFCEWTGTEVPKLPDGVKKKDLLITGVCHVPTVANRDPKVVYTWEGEFMRHTNADTGEKLNKERGDDGIFTYIEEYGEGGVGYTASISDGMKAVVDNSFWNISVTCDWSKIKKPCIRVYPADNMVSQGADLQLGYLPDKEGNPGAGVKNAADYTGNWVGEYVEIDSELVSGDYPWIWITTNTYTGASYIKIEICDAAYNSDGSEYVAEATE